MIAHLLRLILLVQLVAAAAIAAGVMALTRLPLGAAIAVGIGAVVAVRAAITANNFVLARRYGPETVRLHPLGPLRASALFLREFAATLYCSSWSMAFHRPRAYRGDGRHLPVLLIHGWGCNGGYWSRTSRALRRAGIAHRTVDLEPVLAPIDDYVPQIVQAVEQWCEEAGSERIVLVCHSMGGLVARAYLRAAGEARVAHVITLGSPHHGTGLACHGMGENCRQMRWTAKEGASAWLRTLAQSESLALRARMTSIYSLHDNIIAPQRSSELEGARNEPLSTVGHVALALHPRVHELLVEEIVRVSV